MKIKFGAIVTDGRGKIGGHVASKNRSGAYLRTKVTPSNPNTASQAAARSLLASLSQSWGGLTPEQRLAWNDAVSSWAGTDIFGDIKNPSGLNLYVKLNANLVAVELPQVVLPPAKATMPSAVLSGGVYDISTGLLNLELNASDASTAIALVRATPALSQGTTFVKSQYRVIGSVEVDGVIVALTGNYADKFGTVAVGSNIHVSVQFVLPNGQKSVPSTMKVLVVA